MKKVLIITLSAVFLLLVYAVVDFTILSNRENHLSYNVSDKQQINLDDYTSSSSYYKYKELYDAVYPQTGNIVLSGDDYKTLEGEHQILGLYQGLNNVLLTEESGSVTYEFDVTEAGFYHVGLTYYPYEGKSSNIERTVYVNDEILFPGLENLVFHRLWGASESIKQDIYGNDIRPSQVELPRWIETKLTDPVGYVTEPYEIYFEQGLNTVTFESLRETMVIAEVRLEVIKPLNTYEEIKAIYESNNYQESSSKIEIIEAERPLFTTSPTLYPLNDRTSVLTRPSHASLIKLNTIGGNNWRVAGDKIVWEFDVEESGLYEISMRVKQKLATGMSVGRNIYIDGEIPFEEMRNYEFQHSNDWRIQTLGTKNEAFMFYLEEGTHELMLEVSLGQYGVLIDQIQNSISNLNKLYREILVYTGPEPDPYRDYQLTERIDHMVERFITERDTLRSVRKGLIQVAGSKSEKTGILDTMLLQLDDFIKKPREIHKNLTSYNSNISSLGTLITLLDAQPLEIDYFVLHNGDSKLPKAKASMIESFVYSFKSFIASFTTNYAAVGKTTTESTETIEVWLSIGKDQANILRKLIDETFTPQTGVQVDLKLVNSAVLLPATLAGVGPDLAMGIDHSTPVNYAMRKAAADLTQFANYEEVASRFKASAMVPYQYNDGVYALPEQQIFLMMFYRTDIFEELGLGVPDTWDDVISLIPDLQKHNLEFFLPVPTTTGAVANLPANPVFSSMFYQNDGSFYINNNSESGFNEGMGPQVFERWTQFYTDYSFPVEANFVNRFRSGQMPIGITYYNTYNTLSVFAPEIKGKWDFVPIPGTLYTDDEGNQQVRRETISTGTGIMITEQSSKKAEAWQYLDWWTKTETQVRFGREMEGILGSAARYPTANIEAMNQLPWTVKEYEKLEEAWDWVRGIPEVPGGYMTGRHLDNALRLVINDASNPRETIYDYVQKINAEIEKKRSEFGLD
ncbi:MAG: extracellular solute-binding protein [Paracholeplasma sp.]|nr:extracellular solute-binding protein [Paracholeplasma sp.]MDY3196472.1 extracellular solute-binding protein [Paracholeplasma sp.]